jgi:glyoxylase-like metal-dependent hydrolase (beta-lactamase superfamily II)
MWLADHASLSGCYSGGAIAGDLLSLAGGITVLRLGGHFPGSAVLHWPDGAGGRGALFTGDTIFPVPAQGWVTFMYRWAL